MRYPFINTDILIRLLTNDDPVKQEASASLFERVEKGDLFVTATDTVIADTVHVLSSPKLYNVPRSKVTELLTPLVRLPCFRLQNRRVLLAALTLYGQTSLDFGDAMIIASMEHRHDHFLYSYEADFDHIETIKRLEPDETPMLYS